MHGCRIQWSFLGALFLWSAALLAQATPRFEATCNAKETLTDEPFEVVFTLYNARVRQLDPPSFKRLDAQGPFQAQAMTSINGRSTLSESYTYYARASKPGTYRIGSATVTTIKGKTFRSKPLTIKVVQAKKRSMAYSDRLKLQLEVSTEEAIVGEQINVDLRLYQSPDLKIESPNLVRIPTFDNAFAYDLNTFVDRGEYRVLDGQQFYSQVIQRWAVFPNKPGKVTLKPVVMDVSIVERQGGGLFSPIRLVRHRLQTDSMAFTVSDLDGGPAGYDGAIGTYQLQAHIDQNTVRSDDMVELTIRLQGQGNIKGVLPPRLEGELQYFDQFDPTIEEQVGVIDGLYGGVKQYTYVLTPKAEGSFSIRPSLTYFDAQQRKFVTIDTTLEVRVERGQTVLPAKTAFDTVQSAAAQVAAEAEAQLLTFKAPATKARWRATTAPIWWGSLGFWGLLSLPFLLALGVGLWQYQQRRLAARPEAQRRQAAAGSRAQRHLQAARVAQEQGQAAVFYKALSDALLGFVKDHYQLSTLELTKQNVQQLLTEQDVAPAQIEQLMHLLHTADQAVFAGLTNASSMEESYQAGVALLEALDQ